MESSAIIGMAVLIGVISVGLFISRRILAFALPYRKHLYEQGNELLRSGRLTKVERGFVTYCLDNAFSFRAAFLPVRAAWLAVRAQHNGTPAPKTAMCKEVQHVCRLHMMSVLCANPFAALIAFSLIGVLMIREHESARPAFRQTATKLPISYGHMIA